MFQSYSETLAYLYDSLPMFQRIGAAALKPDLVNTLKLCEVLGNPERRFKMIHVAGTNGKGSTSHMLASILQSAGYRTGLYTSPHLKEFTERIRINGEEVKHAFIVDFVNRIKPSIESIGPSFFEITVAMAFDYFAMHQVDVAVIETGLGGRLDSTNIITPVLSIITNIGWDHKDILGDTLEKIASEKAGIIKPGIPVVISERQSNVESVFIERSKAIAAPITFAADRFQAIWSHGDAHQRMDVRRDGKVLLEKLELPLKGFYQTRNVPGVLQVIEVLRSAGWEITHEAIVEGLIKVVDQTGLKGRWQILGTQPLKVCDTGHNIDGIREILKQIRAQHYKQLHLVWGMVKDKDVSSVLSSLPVDAFYYFCQAKIPRAMDAGTLALRARDVGLQGKVIPDVNDAIREAERVADREDMIFIGGSTFVVAEIENL